MLAAGIYEEPLKALEIFKLSKEISFAILEYIISSLEVYKFPENIPIGLTHITFITCNDSLILSVNLNGSVFGWGIDKFGLLGTGIGERRNPTEIKHLYHINKCSLGFDHAAAITKDGLLYTWGSSNESKLGDVDFEHCIPKIVSSAKNYKSEEVICGDNYTCIRTDGCYLFIYGDIGRDHQLRTSISPRKSFVVTKRENKPYSHPKLDTETVIQLVGCKTFIVALLENGEVYALDSCMKLVKFPTGNNLIEYILGNDNYIWGIYKQEVTVWKKNEDTRNLFECPIKNWEINRYKSLNDFKVWTWGEKFLIISSENNIFKGKQMKHSLNVIIEKNVFGSLSESPKLQKEMLSPTASIESLQRLFSKGSNENIIEKIMKCRVEFNNRGTILEAFKGLVHPIAKYAFFKIREYVSLKKIYQLYVNSIRTFCLLEEILQRKLAHSLHYWKKIIKLENFSESKKQKFNHVLTRDEIKAKTLDDKEISELCDNRLPKKRNTFIFSSQSKIFSIKLNKIILRTLNSTFESLSKSKEKAKILDKLNIHLSKIIKKYKSQSLKILLSKSILLKKFVAKLKKIAKKTSQLFLNRILIYCKSLSRKKMSSLYLILNEILCKNHYRMQLHAFRYIKIDTGMDDSDLKMNSDEDFNKFIDDSSLYKDQYTLDINSLQLAKSDSSLAINHQARNCESISSLEASPKTKTFSFNLTSFNKGELIRYQKYLINKKKLDMIKEDNSFSGNEKRSPRYKRKKKEKNKERPPWKPSSASSNFEFDNKKSSAIQKGKEYYENLMEKQSKSSKVLNISKIEDNQKPTILKTCKSVNIFSDRYDSQFSGSPIFYKPDASISLASSEQALDFGLGIVLIAKFIKFQRKKNMNDAYISIKSFKKSSYLSRPGGYNYCALIKKNSWQMGVIFIGFEKLKNIIKKKYSKHIFKEITVKL